MSQQQTFRTPASPSGSGIDFVEGNTGGPVGPDPGTFIINIVGNTTQGVHVNGNPLTFTETITIDDATELQKGVVLLSSNAETLTGADTTKAVTPDDLNVKLGAQTQFGLAYGGGPTMAINWLGVATDGQLPIGQTGGPPVLNNITSTDGTITITNGPGTIDLSVSADTEGTGTTVGAVTADLITIPLGGVAGTFQFDARVKGFEATTPAGAGYNVFATFTTDGVTATLVGNQDIFNEDIALSNADAYFIASGNNAILQVLGVAGLTIDWIAETEKT